MRTRVALASLVIPFVAACGASPNGGTANKTTTGQAGNSTVSAEPSGASSGSVGKAYWYAGFKVTLGQVSIKKAVKPTPPAYLTEPERLLVEARFENVGTENFRPYNHDLALQSGTSSYLDHDSADEKLPEVPGLQSAAGVIAFNVDEKFRLADAVLLVGNARDNQASVPLGNSGKYVSLEPQKVAANGTLALPNAFTLAVSGGDLSYDNPKRHEEEKAGDVSLVLHFSITGIKETCCFGSDNNDLKLPDGTATVSADASNGIPPKDTTKPDQYAEFVFKGVSGSYDYIVKGKYGPDNSDEQADLPITITLGQSASAGATPSVSGSLGSSPSSTQPSPSAGH